MDSPPHAPQQQDDLPGNISSSLEERLAAAERRAEAAEREAARLRAQLAALEQTLARAEAYFGDTLEDVFGSFPGRATAAEHGAVPLSPKHVSACDDNDDDNAPIDIGFSHRFDAAPRVACWLVLRRAGPAPPPAATAAHADMRPKDPLVVRVPAPCVAATARYATVRLDRATRALVRSHSALCARANAPAAPAGSGAPVRVVLQWTAWTAPAVDAAAAEAIEQVYAAPPTLTRELADVVKKCAGRLDARGALDQTLLHAAAATGNAALAEWLVAHGAAVDARDAQGWTPLLLAVAARHAALAAWLLARGADARRTCERGYSALHLLCRGEGGVDAAQLRLADALLAAGLAVDARTDRGETPLLYLCRRHAHCVPLARELLARGADPARADAAGTTPLLVAVRTHNVPLAEVLVAHGARPGAPAPAAAPRLPFPLSVPLSLEAPSLSLSTSGGSGSSGDSSSSSKDNGNGSILPGLPQQKQEQEQQQERQQQQEQEQQGGVQSQTPPKSVSPMALAIRMRSSSLVRALAGPPRHTLTDALWLCVLALLEPRDLCAAAAVSRAWHRMAFALLQTPHYWHRRCGLTRAQYAQYLDLRRQMRARTRLGPAHAALGTVTVAPVPPEGVPAGTPRVTIAVQGLPGAGKSAFIRSFCERTPVAAVVAPTATGTATTPTATPPLTGHALVRSTGTETGAAAVEVVLVEVPPGAGTEGAAVWRAAAATVVVCDTAAAGPDAGATAQHFAAVWRARCGARRAGRVVLAASRCDARTSWHFATALALLQHAAVARLPCFETSAAAPGGVDAAVLHVCAPLLARGHPATPKDDGTENAPPQPVLGTPPPESPASSPPLPQDAQKASDECRLM